MQDSNGVSPGAGFVSMQEAKHFIKGRVSLAAQTGILKADKARELKHILPLLKLLPPLLSQVS